MVVLPLPDGPTSAALFPAGMTMFTPSIMRHRKFIICTSRSFSYEIAYQRKNKCTYCSNCTINKDIQKYTDDNTAVEFSDPEIVFRKGTGRIAEILHGEKICNIWKKMESMI